MHASRNSILLHVLKNTHHHIRDWRWYLHALAHRALMQTPCGTSRIPDPKPALHVRQVPAVSAALAPGPGADHGLLAQRARADGATALGAHKAGLHHHGVAVRTRLRNCSHLLVHVANRLVARAPNNIGRLRPHAVAMQ